MTTPKVRKNIWEITDRSRVITDIDVATTAQVIIYSPTEMLRKVVVKAYAYLEK